MSNLISLHPLFFEMVLFYVADFAGGADFVDSGDFADSAGSADSMDSTDSADCTSQAPLTIIFDILKEAAFRKYSSCWVFFYLGILCGHLLLERFAVVMIKPRKDYMLVV